MKSKAEVWLKLFQESLRNRSYLLSNAGETAMDEETIANAAVDADYCYAEFDARFYAISGGGFGPRPPKKVEGEPAPVITMPPAQE